MIVYCVLCIGEGTDVLHLFSTQEKATAYAEADAERSHVFYDYAVDFPERHEGLMQ